MLCSLILLTGCTTKYVYIDREVVKDIPEVMVTSPCNAQGAGKTVGSLSKGYINNTICLMDHKDQLKAIKQWHEEQKLVNGKGSGG